MTDQIGDCDIQAECANAGKDCNRCTRSYFYEEPMDWFMAKDEEESAATARTPK